LNLILFENTYLFLSSESLFVKTVIYFQGYFQTIIFCFRKRCRRILKIIIQPFSCDICLYNLVSKLSHQGLSTWLCLEEKILMEITTTTVSLLLKKHPHKDVKLHMRGLSLLEGQNEDVSQVHSVHALDDHHKWRHTHS